MNRFPSLPYVLPFAVFLLLLWVGPRLPLDARSESLLRVAILAALLVVFSRGVVSFRWLRPLSSIAVGVGVFLLWIAPDLLSAQWHQHWLFANPLTGKVEGSLSPEARADGVVLALRAARAVVLVPIIEEIFWRGWLVRWIDDPEDFRRIPLGGMSRLAFWVTAILFASEHGPLWDVGLAAGILYNMWMQRTRSLGDLILAHAVTNACLSAYVVFGGKWNYW